MYEEAKRKAEEAYPSRKGTLKDDFYQYGREGYINGYLEGQREAFERMKEIKIKRWCRWRTPYL